MYSTHLSIDVVLASDWLIVLFCSVGLRPPPILAFCLDPHIVSDLLQTSDVHNYMSLYRCILQQHPQSLLRSDSGGLFMVGEGSLTTTKTFTGLLYIQFTIVSTSAFLSVSAGSYGFVR